ncbi:hypothetical protein J3F84DRAFT_289467 [Trichoderma pleuroticola]
MVRPRPPTFPLMAAMACLGGDQWLLGVEAAHLGQAISAPLPRPPADALADALDRPKPGPCSLQRGPMGGPMGPMELRRGPCSCLAPNSARMAGSGWQWHAAAKNASCLSVLMFARRQTQVPKARQQATVAEKLNREMVRLAVGSSVWCVCCEGISQFTALSS